MNNKIFFVLIALIIAASMVFWGFMFQQEPSADKSGLVDAETISLTMYHAEGCMCCEKWADYLEGHGVEVTSEKVNDLQSVKEKYGVTRELSSCHTAIVDGYVVEGHVPIEDIRSLLTERPDAIGISAPGMPPNSPGMDQPVENEYHIVLFNGESMTVYNTHN